jgi:hypothetical protein
MTPMRLVRQVAESVSVFCLLLVLAVRLRRERRRHTEPQ